MNTATSIQNIENARITRGDKIFLDTNIWHYLYYPQNGSRNERFCDIYSTFLGKILEQKCLIFTNILQISEIANLILRTEFKTAQKKAGQNIDWKEFRSSDDGVIALINAKTIVENILRYATPVDGMFNSEELSSIAKSCDKADFNDIFFSHFCVKQSSILVTHDFDFSEFTSGVQVISANKKYF